jgi:hypothetical protein
VNDLQTTHTMQDCEFTCANGCGTVKLPAPYYQGQCWPTGAERCPTCWQEFTDDEPDPDIAEGGLGVRACMDAAVRHWRKGRHAQAHKYARKATEAAIEGGQGSEEWETWWQWTDDYADDMPDLMAALVWRPPVLSEEAPA